MAVRLHRLRQISRFLPRVLSGHFHKSSAFYVVASNLVRPPHSVNETGREIGESLCHIHRYSTVSQGLDDSMHEVDLVSFMKSTLEELEGPNYYWLNKAEGDTFFLKREAASLVLVGLLFGDSSSAGCNSVIIQKLKSIQQRIPELYVIGVHFCNGAGSPVHQTDLFQLITEEYITFPILVTHTNLWGIPKGSSFILLKDSAHPLFYHAEDLDFEVIDKVTKEQKKHSNEQSRLFDNSSWIQKQNDVKEPYLCSTMQNMLLSSPGCISADESGDRLFISDSNHHRIIIADGNGKILDCIGSSPGFEDGNFETAKLFHPGSTLYHDSEDCLFIVDSENHAIRRADLSRRIIETVYPEAPSNKKSHTVWAWIKNKLGLQEEVVVDSETSDTQVLTFPWHLMQAHDDQFYIATRRFDTLWILDSSTWEILETMTGFPNILEVCEELVVEKMSLLKQLPRDWLHEQSLLKLSPEEAPQISHLSSATYSGNYIIACDPVGHRISRICRESGAISDLEFSNFRILGLPYWASSPIEKVYPTVDRSHRPQINHIQRFSPLPGRVEIKLNVSLPADTELLEPLQESCIWRQARGAAAEIVGFEEAVGSSEKVGVAQQWYDELDNLAFTTVENDMESVEQDDSNALSSEDDKVQIISVVNTSPGTSEVIIHAALYLKLRAKPEQEEHDREKQAARLAELLVPEESGKTGRSSCHQIVLNSKSDLQNLVFIKPLQVRIRLETRNHPKADNSKDIILTESSVDVAVLL